MTSCAFCYTDICLIVKMAIAIAYAMGIPKFICFNDMFVCRKCAARLCAFSNHLIQRSHIMRIGKNPQGSGSKHSRRKRSECDFLLCFHCISSMKTAARPVYIPKTQKSYLPHIYRAWRSLSQSPVPVSNLHAPCIGSFLKYAGIISSILHPLTPVSAVWLACVYYTIVFLHCQHHISAFW